jgi:hypothetical protein
VDGLARTEKRAIAPVGDHHEARACPAQRVKEGGEAHLMPPAHKSARHEARRRLAGLERQRAPAPTETGNEARHQHVGLGAVDREDVDVGESLPKRLSTRGELPHARVGCDKRPLRLGAPDDAGKRIGGLVAERGNVDNVYGERVVVEVPLVEQCVGAAEGEDRRVAVMR